MANDGNGRDPILEQLEVLHEELVQVRELLEEVLEKLAELELPYGSV